MTLEIISAGVGGFLAWVLTRSTGHLILRHRLKSYLTVSINISLHGVRENLKWLQKVVDQQLHAGAALTGAPYYERDDLCSLTSTRDRALQLLTARELTLVEKCVRALSEIEALFGGFCRTLRENQASGQPLSDTGVNHLRMRAERLKALIEVLPKGIKTINELPEDYAGTISPDVLVPPPNKPLPMAGIVA